jgi:hypothetical protein
MGYATALHAAPVNEFSIILLDRTGSMSTQTNPTNNPAQTRWTDAMDAARSLVTKDSGDLTNDRAYAIWDFRLGAGTTNNTSQTNAQQVWPMKAADCTDLCKSLGTPNCATFIGNLPTLTGATNNFCDFGNGGITDPYTALYNLLGTYKTDSNRTPDSNRMGRTPLADSLCRILNTMTLASNTLQQTITLESDGVENQSSLGDCGNFSIASTAVPFSTVPASSWDKTKADWGMSAAAGSGAPDALDSQVIPGGGGGSWEARVVRRMLRMTNLASSNATAHSIGAISSTYPAGETATTNIAWRVQLHYATFDSSTSSALTALAAPTTLAAVAPLAVSGSNSDAPAASRKYTVSAALAGITPAMLAAPSSKSSATAATATAAATTSTITVDIPAAELALFNQIASPKFPSKGNGASRSLFQAITLLPGQTYGTDHKLAGDVDDSNCVDRADYNIVTQKDVWTQRAVRPCEICQRADLNRDGWVNELDRAIVLANWGKGCINNPGPKPIVK